MKIQKHPIRRTVISLSFALTLAFIALYIQHSKKGATNAKELETNVSTQRIYPFSSID